ncbi:MAG: PAS domain S-box protein [Actinomycetota bacterium]|nr:PAS domain S-box protein [Actinomycetota bacterium]
MTSPGSGSSPPEVNTRGLEAVHLAAILDAVPTAVVVIDDRGSIEYVNAQLLSLFGYERDELIGHPVEQLLPARFRAAHPRLRAGFFDEPAARPMGAERDLFGARSDGTEFPVEIGLSAISSNGRILGVAAVVDLTERKRHERRFRATVESSPVANIMVDETGTIVLANAEARRLFGYAEHELVGRGVEVLVPEEHRDAHAGLRSRFLAAPSARQMGSGLELHGQRSDGTRFPVEIGLSPVSTAEETFVLAAVLDLTERKRHERRFQETVQSAPIAMVMVDGSGTIVLANTETHRLFGYEDSELIGRKVEVLVPPASRAMHPDLRGVYTDHPSSRRMGEGRDLHGVRSDGSELPVEVGLNPVDIDGEKFVLAAIVDLTERHRLEDGLRESNEALERSNMELQQFAYVASHDLQTPLRSVSGFAQLLAEDYGGRLDDTAEDWIRRIISGTETMQTLVRDLLAFSRVDSQATPFSEIDLGQLVDEVVELLEPSICELGATVERSDLPVVKGDPSQLMQVFENLIGNALKYHGDDPPHVRVVAERVDAMWRVAVSDNGMGIDARHHERIFEIFRRLHTQQDIPGTGIGLAVVRRVAHRHGGDVSLESAPGAGSTFTFTIPVLETS